MPVAFKLVFLILLMASLVSSLAGFWPRDWIIHNMLDADEVRDVKLASLSRKRDSLWFAGILLVAGFACAVLGVAWKIAQEW